MLCYIYQHEIIFLFKLSLHKGEGRIQRKSAPDLMLNSIETELIKLQRHH